MERSQGVDPAAAATGGAGAPDEPSHWEELHAALVRGDEDALTLLLPPLRERLLRLAERRIERGVAEEAVQDAVRTLWEKRESVRAPERLLPFAFQVLRNKIGNAYDRSRRSREVSGGADPDTVASAARDADPALRLEGRELERALDRAIARCAEEHPTWREVLHVLREGRSPSELREELGLSSGAIHVRTHRARERLRQLLASELRGTR